MSGVESTHTRVYGVVEVVCSGHCRVIRYSQGGVLTVDYDRYVEHCRVHYFTSVYAIELNIEFLASICVVINFNGQFH